MIGSGSIVYIVLFALISAGAVTWIFVAQRKNKHNKK
jgi:hypothetical protein